MNVNISINLLIPIILSLFSLFPFILELVEDSRDSRIGQGFLTLLGFAISTILILVIWLIYFIICQIE